MATNNRMALLEQLSKYVVEKDKDFLFLASIIPSGAELNFPSTPAPLLGFHG